MIYLILYLAVGAILLLVINISHQLSKHSESNPALELTKIAQGVTKSLCRTRINSWDNLTDIVVVPLLGMTIILAGWPVLLLMLAKEKLFPYKVMSIPEKVFSVANADLQCQMAVEEIEQNEHVNDPMGTAPDLPFGYLNAAWSQFKSNLEPQDSVWSFAAQWTTHLGCREIREGYVVVRGDNIGPHFLKSLRMIRYEVNDEQDSGLENPDNVLPPFLRPKKR